MSPDDDTADERTDTTARTIPEESDQGKDVVDARGREIGMVAEVEGDTMRVDPHPSLTDKIKSKLDWGDADEEDLPVTPEFVDRIDDDVVLDVERDPEFQDEES